MSHRTHRFDAWHLLAEPTFGAILAPAEGEALAELILDGAATTVDISPFDVGRLPALDAANLVRGG